MEENLSSEAEDATFPSLSIWLKERDLYPKKNHR